MYVQHLDIAEIFDCIPPKPSTLLSFFFNPPSTTATYTLSLHDALPICNVGYCETVEKLLQIEVPRRARYVRTILCELQRIADRKSTRLNSSHSQMSYAVFCLKKKMPSICIYIRFVEWIFPIGHCLFFLF